MKTRLFFFFSVVFLSLVLSACSTESEPPQLEPQLDITPIVHTESVPEPVETVTIKEGDSLYSVLKPFYGTNLNGGNAGSRSIVIFTNGTSYCLKNVNAWSMAGSTVFEAIDILQPGDKVEIYKKGENPTCDNSLRWLRSDFDQNETYWFYFEEVSGEVTTYWRFNSAGDIESSEVDWE